MRYSRKLFCWLLVCVFALQMITLPVFAEEYIEEVFVEEILTEEEFFEEEVFEEIPEEIFEEEIFEEEILEEEIVEEEIFEEEIFGEEIFEEEILEEELYEEEIFEEEVSGEQELPEETELVRTVYDAVPLFFQTDYPDTAYGEGTVATSGCSITCLAMVATYLTGYEYLPDTLARYFAYTGENNMERLEYASEALQLPFEKNWDWQVTLQALQDGNPVIVLVDSNTHFTSSQHFILLTGLTEEGKILVNDPYAPNYAHWALQQGFANGFEEWQIVSGFQGAWVYDRSAMPEEPVFYQEESIDYGPVPLYFQNDYPDTAYGSGTVATSGCSVTSLAMVASWMTGHEYLPDELARYFGGQAENHMERIELGSETLQIPYEKNTDWHVTLQALREGKIAIVLVNSNTYFTQSQHFLVLTGMTPDGKILVNDSWESNYSHWALQDGFMNGFDPDSIMCGFEGAWVYDRSAMPEEPFIYREEQPEAVDYGPVPLYFQNEYPDTRYAGGTVATSGCSVTSLAMVASWMTGHEYLPDELARYFGGRAENHMARIELGSETLQIPYEKNTNWHVTLQALREGKIAIVLVNSNTHFTQTQHFLVLTGMTSDGKILVNDSWEPNYSHWALQDGFMNGFDPDSIMCGFEGAWVYDRSAMPEEPVIYYEPEPERGESRYEGLSLTLAEEDLLAKVVWAEARGESEEGQQAVAEVVLNRLYSGDFGTSLVDVIYGEEQFRSVPYLEDAEPYQTQYEAIEAALYGHNILPLDVYYFATWATNEQIWGQIGNHIFCYAEP